MTGQTPLFNPDDEPPGYLHVKLTEYLAALIAAGELKPGSRFPAETNLARELSVSVGTLRRAMRNLCARGLVTKLPAKGTYVASRAGDR